MDCPKCSKPLKTVQVAGIEVDRCTECKGLWFDEFELEDLRTQKKAREIDTGKPATGGKMNQKGKYDCPRCQSETMIRMIDLQQPHVWYEQCGVYRGIWLDAGEFKDLVDDTFADRVKDWFARGQA